MGCDWYLDDRLFMDVERIEIDLQNNKEKYANKYSDGGFFRKLPKLARVGGIKAVAYAYILYYTLKADTTPTSAKVLICASLGYFVSPLDVIPDFIIGIGMADDILVLSSAVQQVHGLLHSFATPAILKDAINSTKNVFKNEPIENIINIVNQFGFYEQL